MQECMFSFKFHPISIITYLVPLHKSEDAMSHLPYQTVQYKDTGLIYTTIISPAKYKHNSSSVQSQASSEL